MWNWSRLTWINDGLNQALVAVVSVAAVALFLIVARGWAW
jgi:hypothetical protein